MRLFLFSIVTIALLFPACDQITEPVLNSDQFEKSTEISNNQTAETIKFSIIPLPAKSAIYLDSIFTVTKTINGLLGGIITLDKAYISKEGKLVTMLVNMVIPPLAFLDVRDITITIKDSVAVMDCGPSMIFRRSLICLQTFTGLNLNYYNTEEIDFMYISDNGYYESIPRTALVINKTLGLVSIINARINHFTKYGWVRKHGNSN